MEYTTRSYYFPLMILSAFEKLIKLRKAIKVSSAFDSSLNVRNCMVSLQNVTYIYYNEVAVEVR